jgi:hypothetical protein
MCKTLKFVRCQLAQWDSGQHLAWCSVVTKYSQVGQLEQYFVVIWETGDMTVHHA